MISKELLRPFGPGEKQAESLQRGALAAAIFTEKGNPWVGSVRFLRKTDRHRLEAANVLDGQFFDPHERLRDGKDVPAE